MSTGIIRLRTILCLGAAVCMCAAQASEIAIVSVETPSSTQFAEWTKQESSSNLAEKLGEVWQGLFEKADHQALDLAGSQRVLGEKWGVPLRSKDATAERLAAAAEALKIRYVAAVHIVSVKQKNKSAGEQLANMAGAGSLTEVECVVEVYDALDKILVRLPSNRTSKGSFAGPYFGTVRRDEMSGDPQTKSILIRNENRKRIEAIAKAAWNAISDALLRQIAPKS